ncbi:MAG TPA: LysM peptidoglycan-binding domain-containing protein [Chloroflexi bacterium]|nr:LysM peptidoglycan-binding domain-containing protein [Chloroflexota bacterium]
MKMKKKMRKWPCSIIALLFILILASPVSAQSQVHVVRAGENLFRIALRYGVTVDALARANGLSDASHIYVGQRLTIPGGSGSPAPSPDTPSVHVVQAGENLYRIALRYGISYQSLAAANGIANPNHIYAGQRLMIPGGATPSPQPSPSGQTYTVRRGDTLSAIALRFGVSMWALARANGISNPSFIYVGQVLRIPAGGSPAPAPAPSPAPTGGRWIDVDLSAQRVTAYVGNTPVRSTLVSTGLPATPTPTGQYRIYVKYVSTTMSGPGYHLTNVPYTMYFYRGYGLHGTYWHANFGQPMSHGCINLPTPEAQWFFNWAPVGTLVNIHY